MFRYRDQTPISNTQIRLKFFYPVFSSAGCSVFFLVRFLCCFSLGWSDDWGTCLKMFRCLSQFESDRDIAINVVINASQKFLPTYLGSIYSFWYDRRTACPDGCLRKWGCLHIYGDKVQLKMNAGLFGREFP